MLIADTGLWYIKEADECSKDIPEKADEDIMEIPVVEINHILKKFLMWLKVKPMILMQ